MIFEGGREIKGQSFLTQKNPSANIKLWRTNPARTLLVNQLLNH